MTELTQAASTYDARFKQILDTMIQGMTTAQLDDSISHNFIVQMIPHHKAAIEMSLEVLKYTQNAELRSIAEHIVSAQTKSISDLEDALQNAACADLDDSKVNVFLYQAGVKLITSIMFHDMRTALVTNNITCTFMRQMIPHHRGAVRMSKLALKFKICDQLKPFLEAIITSQEEGIKQMEALLKELHGNKLA